MKKNYVLDTNVLLYDPQAIFKFEDNNVFLPITITEELDKFKKDMNETGRNARHFARIVDDLIRTTKNGGGGKISKGIPLEGGGTLQAVLYREDVVTLLPEELRRKNVNDNIILAVALSVKSQHPSMKTVMVTKDTNLRIKADACDMEAQDYEHGKLPIDELYTGVIDMQAPRATVDRLRSGKVVPNEMTRLLGYGLLPNQFVILRPDDSENGAVAARFDAAANKMVVPNKNSRAYGLEPRNLEQTLALNILLDDSIKLVTLVGKAGTGKTLLAIAAGLAKVGDEQLYNKLLVSRPVFPMGKDLGFLPGDIEEKLTPWMQPIFDNVELLLSGYGVTGRRVEQRGRQKQGKKQSAGSQEKEAGWLNKSYKELQAMGILDIEPLTYIRGRSIPYQYLVVDEAQNLTPHEIKTIITRAGEGTKVVLTGDPYQIDNPYVDASSNGLTYVVEKLKEQHGVGHVTMTRGERSALAEMAANLL